LPLRRRTKTDAVSIVRLIGGYDMRFLVLGSLVVGASLSAMVYIYWQRPNPEAMMDRGRISAQEARRRLAFESLEDRLPTGKGIPGPKEFSSAANEFWAAVDRSAQNEHDYRAKLLKGLHEKTETFFVDSPGYGRGRMKYFPEEVMLSRFPDGPAEQPGEAAQFPLSTGEALDVIPPSQELTQQHQNDIHRFIRASGFGYMIDRRQVAGFTAHGFRWGRRDDPKHRYQVDHILLVGLLKHELPVVYVSDQLPSMKHMDKAVTRPIDVFEDAGLWALARGDDLFVIQKDDALRMLGALRATPQCIACHDAEPGDLLGAFSYTLRARKAKN
jgi:hypothetical protein